MSFFDSLRIKAPFLDKLAESFTSVISRDEKFRLEYKLEPSETVIDDTNADISVIRPTVKDGKSKNFNVVRNVEAYSGKLLLTPHFILFKDTIDEDTCQLVLNISTIKRVERSRSDSYSFTLKLTLYSGTQILIQFIGLRSRSEQFCNRLKVNLKQNIPLAKTLPAFMNSFYSEFLIAKNVVGRADAVAPKGGLGQKYKYPGHPIMVKEKAKLRLWFEFFKENGRNMAIVKNPMFAKLIRVGIPNRLRGEIWELCSGAMYLRFNHQGEYQNILEDNKNKTSQAIDEIEKDLKRSLPEYIAYQEDEGIQKLRNVLVAYSWKNPDVGYCQAMNIVVAGLLIYMTEEQAFWCLCNMCELYVPGYYSKTMYGTLLDQRVFEAMVEERMPDLWKFITSNDIQLSVVSLPWFLSLFFTSMPLEYAVRIMDIFFLRGSVALLQVALAVIKLNSEDIMEIEDDGMFIAIIKNYFHTLGDSAYPDSENPKLQQVSKFQQLLVTAFKEFNNITETSLIQERHRYENQIMQNVETFVKRTQIRHLPKVFNLQDSDLSNIYDIYYQCVDKYKISKGTGSSNMEYEVFIQFLSKLCDWCKPENEDLDPIFKKQKRMFIRTLFDYWDVHHTGELTINEVVVGLDRLLTKDLMQSINNFFSLYDKDNDGELHREDVLQMSEGLLFLTHPWKTGAYIDFLTQKAIEDDIANKIVQERYQNQDGNTSSVSMDDIELPKGVTIDEEKYKIFQTERYLRAASSFLQRCFEYAKPLDLSDEIDLIDLSDSDVSDTETDRINKKKAVSIRANAALDPEHPSSIDVATFRMIILADETYELFFDRTLRSSIHVDETAVANGSKNKAIRNVFDGILADGRRVAEQVRRRVDSVATRASVPSSITSDVNNSGAVLSDRSSNGHKEENDMDLEDFTNNVPDTDDVLQNAWLDETVDEPNENEGLLQRPDLTQRNTESSTTKTIQVAMNNCESDNPDLIEFEAD